MHAARSLKARDASVVEPPFKVYRSGNPYHAGHLARPQPP